MPDSPEGIRIYFSIPNHSNITSVAGAAAIDAGELSRTELNFIIGANASQDSRQFESKVHFDNCAFAEGAEYIQEQWEEVEAADDPTSFNALTSFGQLLHTVQDFYSHSNWVELHDQADPIPIWNLDTGTLPAGIVSGTWVGEPKRCAAGAPSHDDLNKDSESSSQGQKVVSSGPNQGASLYSLARTVAIQASVQQFNRLLGTDFEPLINEHPQAKTWAQEAERVLLVELILSSPKRIPIQRERS